jgi:hypothetical protein
MSLICFTILAHENEDVLIDQVENVKRYNPTAEIVMYNGGRDPNFGKSAGIDICPYSRPLRYHKFGRCLFDIMTWLEEINLHYDYLVNLDSDNLFVNPGFESWLNEQMADYDVMGIWMQVYQPVESACSWGPGWTMIREWEVWQPLFQTDFICRTLNASQTFRRDTVKRILSVIDATELERLLQTTQVFALEEMIYSTLAVREGSRYRAYPDASTEYWRLGEPLSVEEVEAAKGNWVHIVHPIERSMDNPARIWIRENTW